LVPLPEPGPPNTNTIVNSPGLKAGSSVVVEDVLELDERAIHSWLTINALIQFTIIIIVILVTYWVFDYVAGGIPIIPRMPRQEGLWDEATCARNLADPYCLTSGDS
jgi:hypothetical protein